MGKELFDKNISHVEYIKERPIPNTGIEDLNKITPGCTILSYDTLEECSSKLKDTGNKPGCFNVKIPVILTILDVEMNIKADLVLEKAASDIIRTSDSIFLKECRLLPLADKLFFSGSIRRSVEYAPWGTPYETQPVTVRQCVFNIPFKFVTKVAYYTPPKISINCDNNIKHYNEKILCELIRSEFYSDSYYEKGSPQGDTPYIQRLGERIIVKITLKLLQNQDIQIDPTAPLLRL